jgi:hypothetical protein
VATRVTAPSLGKERNVLRAVSVRTKDDVAVIQDLPEGENQLAHGFPLTPSFDALSYFTLSWQVSAHQQLSSYVHDVKPLTFIDPQTSDSDVVVFRLRQYKASFAPDSSDAPNGKTHITLEPYDYIKKQVVRPDSTFFLSDLYIDNASGLPSEVAYSGADDLSFIVDYATIDGYWLVNHAHYEQTIYAPLRIARLHVIADSVYSDFAFPTQAPDPRLAN